MIGGMRFRAIFPLLVAASLSSCAAEPLPVLEGTVTRVIDGDTIDVQLQSGAIRVRLDSIEAPERVSAVR
jgi:endonuclease YncB( thermonuclease family)